MAWQGYPLKVVTVTIAQGASVSSAGDLEGFELSEVSFPPGFEGEVFTFQTSPTQAGSYQNRYDDAADEVIGGKPAGGATFLADKAIGLDAIQNEIRSARYVRVRAGTAAAAQAQAAPRTVTLVGKREG